MSHHQPKGTGTRAQFEDLRNRFWGDTSYQKEFLQKRSPDLEIQFNDISSDDFFDASFEVSAHEDLVENCVVERVDILEGPIEYLPDKSVYKHVHIHPQPCNLLDRILTLLASNRKISFQERVFKDVTERRIYVCFSDTTVQIPGVRFQKTNVLIQITPDPAKPKANCLMAVYIDIQCEANALARKTVVPCIYEKVIKDLTKWAMQTNNTIKTHKRLAQQQQRSSRPENK